MAQGSAMVRTLGGFGMDFEFPVEMVVEGAAGVVVPRLEEYRMAKSDYAPSKAPVFYNPQMKMNRDIAVLVLRTYQRILGRQLSVSEPLVGCGVRGIRFAKEVQGIQAVYLNDINPVAFRMAQHNVKLNGLVDKVHLANKDANLFLSEHAGPHTRFDYIDMDPFGPPVPYIDSAFRALRDGGLLALTATDLAPLCGVYPRVALRKYGGLSLRTEYSHELGLRLLIGCMAVIAARHEIGVRILFSHSADHYVRVYALANLGAKRTDESLRKMGHVLHCFQCLHREVAFGIVPEIKRICSECGSSMKPAGPLWLGEIADEKFLETMEQEASRGLVSPLGRAVDLLSVIRTESSAPATFYVVDKVCDRLNIPIPASREVIRRLREEGFEAFHTHFHTRGIKTNAPAKAVAEATAEAFR